MDISAVFVTTLLFANCFVMSMGNVNSTEATNLTTDIHGATESHKTTVETLNETEANTQTISQSDPWNLEATTVIATVSNNIDDVTDNKTISSTDGYKNTNKTNPIDNINFNASSMPSGDVTWQQQKPNEATESVTTVYKVEAKTKSLEEVEPNMDRFIDPPSPNIDIAAAVNVEQNDVNETHPGDAQTTHSPDENAHADLTTSSILDETTTFSQQEDIPLLLKELIKQHLSKNNITRAIMKENTSGDGIEDHNSNSDKKQSIQFFEWLDRIKPNRTETKSATVTVKNADIDTRIITTDKLVIVISTISGSFVLFVVILLVVSCCRKNKNARTDSEKSGTSEFSVVSTRSSGIYEKQSSTKSRNEPKNDYNDVFMGIPTNNAIWKDLDNLPETASSVMPESTKL